MLNFTDPVTYIFLSVFFTALGGISLYNIGPIHFRPYQIPLIIALLLLIFKFLISNKKIVLPIQFFLVLLIFYITIIISFLNAPFPILTLKQSILLFLYVILYFLIINVCTNKKNILQLHKVIIFSCFVACVYGVIMLVLTNLPNHGREGGYFYSRPRSFFVEPNEFGEYLVFVFGYIFSEYASRKKIVNRRIFWITFYLILILLVPNMSRGSWLGCVVIMFLVFYYQDKLKLIKVNFAKKIKTVFFIFCFSVITLLVVSKFIPKRWNMSVAEVVTSRISSLFSGTDATSSIRIDSNKKAFKTMFEYPFTGIGLGNAFTVMQDVKKNDGKLPNVIVATSSNFIADLGMELGLFGLGSFILFLFFVFFKGIFSLKKIKDTDLLVVYIGAFASYIGLLINSLTYSSYLLPFLWISAGIISAGVINDEL